MTTITLMYGTVRLSLALYALALAMMLAGKSRSLARVAWTIGCALMLVHIALAMGAVHGWSHNRAADETTRQTLAVTGIRFAYGVWFNYAFALVWVGDVIFWWKKGHARYFARAWPVTALMHGYLLFIAINSAIVFVRGPTRYVSIAACAVLTIVAVARNRIRPSPRPSPNGVSRNGE